MSRSPAPPADELAEDVVDDVDPGRAWRQGRLRRVTVWAALAAGPLALFASCASARVPARTPAHAVAAAVAPTVAQDPSGFAQLFVSLWLRTDGSADDAHLAALRALAPNVDLRTAQTSPSNAVSVAQCAAVHSAQISAGYWSVVVGCESDSANQATVRYYAVPVQMDQPGIGSGSLAVVAQPAAVAAPTPAGVPPTLYPDSAAAGTPLASAVSAFATAYLTRQGDVGALLTPGAPAVRATEASTRAAGPATASQARHRTIGPAPSPMTAPSHHPARATSATSARIPHPAHESTKAHDAHRKRPPERSTGVDHLTVRSRKHTRTVPVGNGAAALRRH